MKHRNFRPGLPSKNEPKTYSNESTIQKAHKWKVLIETTGATLQQIGNMEGITRERVRQILTYIGYSIRGSVKVKEERIKKREAQMVTTPCKKEGCPNTVKNLPHSSYKKKYCSRQCSGYGKIRRNLFTPEEKAELNAANTPELRKRLLNRFRMRHYLPTIRHLPWYKEMIKKANYNQRLKTGWKPYAKEHICATCFDRFQANFERKINCNPTCTEKWRSFTPRERKLRKQLQK